MVLGANGCGKTTVFRTMLGFIPTLAGEILVDGTPLGKIPRKQLAHKLAYVPQEHLPPFPYTVEQVVLMGRSAYVPAFSSPSREDFKISAEALETVGIFKLKDRVYTEISGGERRLALIARALAQKTDYIIMDEPGSYLDYGNRIRFLEQAERLAAQGIGVCMTTHSPEEALISNSRTVVVAPDGKLHTGNARSLLTQELICSVYGLSPETQMLWQTEHTP